MDRFVFALIIFLAPAVLLAHGGHKHVIGTVSSLSASTLVVKTSSGGVSVPLSKETKFYRGSGTEHLVTFSEVKRGMRVVAHLGGNGKAAEVHIPKTKE